MEKVKIDSLSLSDLMDYDAAAKDIIAEYASMARKYDGSFNGTGDEMMMIEKYNRIHNKIKFELMRRLDSLE
jgi:hypothetical protein